MDNDTADFSLPCQNVTVVDESEAGQKLLQLLQRRLSLPQNLLHRWIRSGQVRLNGCRCTPFARVMAGDRLRLPPFADKCCSGEANSVRKPIVKKACPDLSSVPGMHAIGAKPDSAYNPASLDLIGEYKDIMAFNKPAGLAVHPGSSHQDSFVSRLHIQFAGSRFMPTPAHRLDKDTSGILLVAKSYQALQWLHSLFRSREIVKEYFAWVDGVWQTEDIVMLKDLLVRRIVNGKEKICVAGTEDPRDGARQAICLAKKIGQNGQQSLLQIRLLTGQKHQIRAQLASAGHPVTGDRKYGKCFLPATVSGLKKPEKNMYLHAFRIVLPDGHTFTCMPGWKGGHLVEVLPEVIAYQKQD